MKNYQELLEKLFIEHPELKGEIFDIPQLEQVPSSLKDSILQVMLKRIAERFFEDLWSSVLSTYQKQKFKDLVKKKANNQEIIKFLNKFVPNWRDIFLYHSMVVKLNVIEKINFLKNSSSALSQEEGETYQ